MRTKPLTYSPSGPGKYWYRDWQIVVVECLFAGWMHRGENASHTLNQGWLVHLISELYQNHRILWDSHAGRQKRQLQTNMSQSKRFLKSFRALTFCDFMIFRDVSGEPSPVSLCSCMVSYVQRVTELWYSIFSTFYCLGNLCTQHGAWIHSPKPRSRLTWSTSGASQVTQAVVLFWHVSLFTDFLRI